MSEKTLDDLSAIEMQLERVKTFADYPGFDLILDGLMLLAVYIEQRSLTDESIEHLLGVVSEFADIVDVPRREVRVTPIHVVEVEPELAEESENDFQPPDSTASRAPEHIVVLFREEARKRLAGLSISMMGVFYPESADVSIEQSTGHLHAVKGSAAMIGFPSIAELSGAMERVMFTLREKEDDVRGAALRPLLRSYSVLESLVESVGDRDADLDVSLDVVMKDLRRLLGEPMQEPPPPARQSFDRAPETGIQSAPPMKRILVVDDDKTVSATVGLVLADLGVEIDVADDGAQALDRLVSKPYSLVISDISMPHLDGLTLFEQMRSTDALVDIPLILLTGRTHEERPEGVSDLIIKGSIGSGELRSRVAAILIDAPIVPHSETLTEKKILIVEDAETIAASIAFVLSEGPYEITIAFDGEDGWEKLNAERFDAVITDWQMPRMNGLQLLEKIRSSVDLGDLPVVMLTSTDTDDLREQASELGVSRFMIKGDIGSDALLTMVGSLVEE